MMRRRLLAIFMLGIWITGLFGSFMVEVNAAETEVQSIMNNVVEIMVNKEDGRFAVKTVQGSPQRPEDDNAALLFNQGIPETTFTTFRIDGKDYIYGNTYNGLLTEGGMVSSPKVEGMVNTSSWRIGDITVTQKLELTDNVTSSDIGNVKISYTVTNNGTKSSVIGTRILLDMMLGDNDGCSISLDGNTNISYETKVEGSNIPMYWRCTDSVDKPKIVSYGFLKGWGNKEPDSMIIAHWSSLSSTKWDYEINPQRNIGSSLNDFKTADSAAALYWDPRELEPGKVLHFETYYGLGNISDSASGDTFSVNIMAPSKLDINGEIYGNNPFDILMELDNSLGNSADLAGINAELILPAGLELAEGEVSSHYLYNIPVGQKANAAWKVKALNTQNLKVLQYMIRIWSFDNEIKSIKKFIIIPGFENNDSDIGYTDIVPRNLYYEDEESVIHLIGYGFERLRDKSSYEMNLIHATKGTATSIAEYDIAVINDNQIRIKLPEGLNPGNYKLSINHKDDMLDYTLGQYITVTTDTKYKSRNYGIMAIKEENVGGKKVHKAVLYENESQLIAADKNSVVLIIRGKIRSISDTSFDVYGDGIAINNGIFYKGYGDSALSVVKNGDSFRIMGSGELYMKSALEGKSKDVTLKKGHFYIDSANNVIMDQEGYMADKSILKVGYFPIEVKEFIIQKSGEVKVDGILQLENKFFNFLTSVGEGFMESDLKDLKITNKNIDINTEIKLPFPRWKLGSFQSKDYASKKMTNITFFINTRQGAYGFRTQAESPKLKLEVINATMAFDNYLYPDYFEFEGKYGKIPKPIGSTGLAFESVGGGLYGLKSFIDSLRHGNLPTGSSIAVRADIVDLLTYNSRIKGYTLVGLRDIEAILSTSGLDLTGDGYIYFIDVGDINGHFDFSGGYVTVDLNILDIIIADAYIGISKHEIKGTINAELRIPKYIWFIGGETVAGYRAEFSTKKIAGHIKVLGIGVGVEYEWGGKVSFDIGSASPVDRKGIYIVNTKDEDGRDVTISYGTNIEKLGSIPYHYYVCYDGSLGRILAMGADEYTYNPEIVSSVESAIIEMMYDSDETPEVTVTDPDGNEYELIEDENYMNQVIPADVSSSGMEEKRLFVTIVSPKVGTWTIKSDKEVTMTLYNAKEPAEFESLSAKQEGNNVKVDWELNVTDGSKVELYLVKDDGSSMALNMATNLNGYPSTYEWNIPDGITTGSYKVRGVVKRSVIGSEDSFSFNEMYSDAFEIVDALSPAAPTNFKVEAIGNGMMKAQWDAAAGINEYRIYAVDSEGKIDNSVKTMVSVEGDATDTIFGGTLLDDSGNEYGWIPDRSYRFALYAIKRTLKIGSEEIEHISKPSFSDEIYLPKPEPPEFTVDFTAGDGNINVEKDENGNDVYYTNTRYIDCRYQSDKNGNAVFYVNDEKVDETKERNYSFQLDLDDGSNLVEVEVTGDNGDKITKSYELYYDDRAPELMVQSPNNYVITQSGSILVSGLTTAGSRLYVNGSEVNVGDDGSFNENYVLTNNDRETITITSMDLAGNMTEYTAEVLNSSVNDVVKVQIRPDISQLRAGESVQLKLYGLTSDNNELLLASDKVNWQIYGDEGAAAITAEGRLTANRTGEIAVSGSYTLSPDKAYEDAMIINIIPNPGNRDDDRDRDRDNKTDEKESNESSSLIRRMNFQANEEIRLPGQIRLKFTGIEELTNGYLEIHEIKDLIKYRPKSGKKSFVSNIFDIRLPEGYELNSPVELTIYFDKNKVKNLKQIFIYVYNEKTGQWDMVGGTVDEDQGAITVRLPHFSMYAVMENSELTIMTDMANHWAKDAVYRLVDMGIVNGIKSADGSYKYEPDKAVTRAEFSKMLALSSGYVHDNNDVDLSNFADDEEILTWVRPYLKYCNEKGWINGKGIGNTVYMKPNDTITRAEAGVMISRALGFEAKDKNIKAAFPDKNQIPAWAAGYIDELVDKKLMQGRPDGTFRPNEVMNRAEVAALIDNYVRMQKDSY